ncbi:glycosyltransferase family 4 protein [Agromyces soli]
MERDVRMLAAEHEVSVVHLVAPAHADGGPTVVERDGIRVVRVPMTPGAPRSWWAAARALRRHFPGADLVNSHAATSLWPMVLARPARGRWVHTEHSSIVASSFADGRAARRARAIRRRLFSRPAVVVAVSDHLGQQIRRLGRSGPIVTVPNAVTRPSRLTTRPSEPSGVLRLVAVGGLTQGKRPLLAIRTLAELRRRGVDARLDWVGDGPLRAEAAALVAELDLEDAVVLAGAQRPEDVGKHLEAAHLFLLPTEGETFGVAIAEAIAHGLPVVVGARGGQRVFVDASVGALVDSSEPAAYADAVQDVVARTRGLDPAEIAATLGERFDDAHRLAAYDAVYTALAAGRSPGTVNPQPPSGTLGSRLRGNPHP